MKDHEVKFSSDFSPFTLTFKYLYLKLLLQQIQISHKFMFYVKSVWEPNKEIMTCTKLIMRTLVSYMLKQEIIGCRAFHELKGCVRYIFASLCLYV